jgi:hypothetical protein
MRDLLQAYGRRLGSDDPVIREAARRQLARLGRSQTPPTRAPGRRSHWAHVPLDVLFSAQGNRLRTRSDGKVETGHEPMHGSRSGRCVLLDPSTGRWWCRSCGRSGDAATYVMMVLGCTYSVAAAWLSGRYGPPTLPAPRRSQVWLRRRVFEAVVG